MGMLLVHDHGLSRRLRCHLSRAPSPSLRTLAALTAGDAAPKEVKLISDADAFAFNCTQRAHQNFRAWRGHPVALAPLLVRDPLATR